MSRPAIEIAELDFRYAPGAPLALRQLSVSLPAGERCLVVGANGAGKTTLLRVLGGKHMIAPGAVRVLGRSAFDDTSLSGQVQFIGGPIYPSVDVPVAQMLDAHPDVDAARREALLGLLGVDPAWRMHRISDGQRRRVQLAIALLRPARVLLLDEITTDLDIVARSDLLAFLREESEQRGVTVLYATHILDRLEQWATQLMWLDRGRLRLLSPIAEIEQLRELHRQGVTPALSTMVERWLRSAGR